MIIARAPLRVSLAGGGTDLPWFENLHGSRLVATTIDKYVSVIVSRRWDDKLRVAYAKTELVDDASQLEHPLFREALQDRTGIEVHTTADVPANTGLGSSGTFLVALVAALDALDGERRSAFQIALTAQQIEQRVEANVGWQDHFAAAMGGTRLFSVKKEGPGEMGVDVASMVRGLDDLQLWFTGVKRRAADVLDVQAADQNATSMLLIRGLVDRVLDGEHVGDVLDRHHQLKIATAPNAMTTGEIEQHAHAAKCAGAKGVKLVGAGGGGFLLVATESADRFAVMSTLERRGLKWLPVRFGVPGVEVLRW